MEPQQPTDGTFDYEKFKSDLLRVTAEQLGVPTRLLHPSEAIRPPGLAAGPKIYVGTQRAGEAAPRLVAPGQLEMRPWAVYTAIADALHSVVSHVLEWRDRPAEAADVARRLWELANAIELPDFARRAYRPWPQLMEPQSKALGMIEVARTVAQNASNEMMCMGQFRSSASLAIEASWRLRNAADLQEVSTVLAGLREAAFLASLWPSAS